MLGQSDDPEAYAPLKAGFRKLIEDTYRKAPGPEIIARTVLKAVTSRNPRPRYATPLDSKTLIWARRVLGDRILDWLIGRQLKA